LHVLKRASLVQTLVHARGGTENGIREETHRQRRTVIRIQLFGH